MNIWESLEKKMKEAPAAGEHRRDRNRGESPQSQQLETVLDVGSPLRRRRPGGSGVEGRHEHGRVPWLAPGRRPTPAETDTRQRLRAATDHEGEPRVSCHSAGPLDH